MIRIMYTCSARAGGREEFSFRFRRATFVARSRATNGFARLNFNNNPRTHSDTHQLFRV